MKEYGKGGEGVGESGKKWYFCLSVGKSGNGGEEWVGVRRSRLGPLNHERYRALNSQVHLSL